MLTLQRHHFKWFFLISYTVTVSSWNVQVGSNSKQARFDRFDGLCRGNKFTKILFDYHSIKTDGNKLYMNNTITVREDVNTPPTLTLSIQRCRSRENPDTCESFHALTTKKYCDMITSDSDMWKPFFGHITPPWKCPLKKGVYQSINAYFDVTAILLFPADGWFWKVRGEMFDGETGKKIMCIIVEAKVMAKKQS